MQRFRFADAHRGQLFRHAGVGHFQRPGFIQTEFDGGNHPLIAFAFETRVAVAERALGMAQAFDAATGTIEGFDGFDEFAHFGAIGPDVLNRAGADRSGNQCHVFQTVPTAGQGPMHQFVPEHAGFSADQRLAVVLFQDFAVVAGQAQYQAGVVGGEQHIAAFAQYQHLHAFHRGQIESLADTGRIADIAHGGRTSGDVQGVAAGQRDVIGPRQGLHQPAPSRRRCMALTHSPISSGPR